MREVCVVDQGFHHKYCYEEYGIKKLKQSTADKILMLQKHVLYWEKDMGKQNKMH